MLTLSKQEVFNRAYIGVLQQRAKATNGNTCLYRVDEGVPVGQPSLACGIGWSMTDKEARWYSSQSISQVIADPRGQIRARFKGIRTTFLQGLQDIHDNMQVNSLTPDNVMKVFKDNMANYAKQYHLTVPSDDQVKQGIKFLTEDDVK
jgi:hypothetical protein